MLDTKKYTKEEWDRNSFHIEIVNGNKVKNNFFLSLLFSNIDNKIK